jgi:hypothetical protein
MPTYRFKDKNTGEEWEEFMGISAADKYLEENKHIERMVHGIPMMASGVMNGARSKPDDAFRDLLKDMKKKQSGGFTGSTINTF